MNTNATADIIASLKSGVSVNATAENTGKPIHTVLNVYKTSAELAQLRQANLLAKQNRKVIHPKDLPYVKAVLAGEMTQTEAAEKWGVKQSWVSLQVSRHRQRRPSRREDSPGRKKAGRPTKSTL